MKEWQEDPMADGVTKGETVQDEREDRGRPGRMWGSELEQLDFKFQPCHLLAM